MPSQHSSGHPSGHGSAPTALADGFDAASDEAWRALVDSSLKGRPSDPIVTRKRADGLSHDALATAQSSTPVDFAPRPAGPWDICSAHWTSDARAMNNEILEDLERGVTAIAIKIAFGATPGLALQDLGTALEGVFLDLIRLNFAAGEETRACVDAFLALAADKAISLDAVQGGFGADPIGTLAQTGRLHLGLDGALVEAAGIAQMVADRLPGFATFSANGSVYHSAGASDALEIACTVSTALAYMRAMEAMGLTLEQAAQQIQLGMAASAEVFLTTAKTRALRVLWSTMLGQMGVNNPPVWITAGSALRMMTRRDPWMNILRGTSACFAAGAGGADSVTVLPLDTFNGMPGPMGRRLARNTQVILLEESYMGAVSDPAAGSYAVESLTQKLVEEAWGLMQQIETAGGMPLALESGLIRDLCDAIAVRRADAIAKRKQEITGVSAFPLLGETLPKDTQPYPAPPAQVKPAAVTVDPLPFRLDASPYEQFRDHADALKADAHKVDAGEGAGSGPSVYLATLGPVARHTGRVGFARNLFEAGGIAASVGDIEACPTDALVVLCGADSDYEAEGEAAIKSLKSRAPKRLFIAGRPANLDALTSAGADQALYLGMDTVKVLEDAFTRLGDSA